MNIVGYCRVSTEKESQISSLEHQKEFFEEYADKHGHNLVKLYADEGITGTKLKNRKEFNRLMLDAQTGLFEMVVVKDIARFARNTLDFLQNIRTLKSLNINTKFVTQGMETIGNGDSELTLTMLAAVAQEESVNTSIKVKFGKQVNAKKGKVPNFVYGYQKTIGDYFNLAIIPEEEAIVKRIFALYTDQGYGANKIASILSSEGIKTRNGCKWSQIAITRILSNRIYVGQVVNGKEEIKSLFDTKRNILSNDKWIIVENPGLRIITDNQFEKAQNILHTRKDSFKKTGAREGGAHLFSGIMKCSDCGFSFRYLKRAYKNPYVSWVCSGRNLNGIDFCNNKSSITEDVLTNAIRNYFREMLLNKQENMNYFVREFKKSYHSVDNNKRLIKELESKLSNLRKQKSKDMEMFSRDIISIDELDSRAKIINSKMNQLESELKVAMLNIDKGDVLEERLNNIFGNMNKLLDVEIWDNWMLKSVIDKIVVKPDKEIHIYLKMNDLFGKETVQVDDNRT